jgi:alpha-galactosidase
MKGVIEGNQGHTYGLSSWLPWQGSGVYFTDSYAVRSFLLSGFDIVPPGAWEKSEETKAAMKRGYDEARKVAPFMFGDYYPLTAYSLQPDRWIAWQFHRPDHQDGVVQAFRRAEAQQGTLTVQLRDLEPDARYEVENLDRGKETHSGRELTDGLAMTLKSAPAATVYTYRKQ